MTFQAKMRISSCRRSVNGREGREGAKRLDGVRVEDRTGTAGEVDRDEDVAGTGAVPIPCGEDRRRRFEGGGLIVAMLIEEDWHGSSTAPPKMPSPSRNVVLVKTPRYRCRIPLRSSLAASTLERKTGWCLLKDQQYGSPRPERARASRTHRPIPRLEIPSSPHLGKDIPFASRALHTA